MHDELGRVAVRRGAAWVLAAAVVASTGPGVVGLARGGWDEAAAWSGLAFLVALGVLVVDGARGARAAEPRLPVEPATGTPAGLAATAATAIGRAVPSAWVVDHPAPNVAVLPSRHGDRLLLTTGALARLRPDQLEAVVTAQVALAGDRTVRRLLQAAATLDPLRWGALGGLTASTILAVFRPVATLQAMVVWATVGAAALLFSGRVGWWAGVAADAVCIRTTRHPEALAEALVVLAGWNGAQVPVRARVRKLWTPVGAWWAVPVGVRWTSSASVDGRVTSRKTSEQEADVRLLLRAAAVRRLGSGEPATLAAYRRVADHLRRAGADAAAGRATDVDGIAVTLRGAAPRRRGRAAGSSDGRR